MQRLILFSWITTLSLFMWTSQSQAVPKAQKLFQSLTGTPLLNTDARLAQMQALLDTGKLKEAATIATADPNFLNVRIRHWAAALSNKQESPDVPFNDFQAMIVGVTRDGMDARNLLSGNFRYQSQEAGLPPISRANNSHYAVLEELGVDLKTTLVKAEPQWDDKIEAAGLLTTRGWAEAHLNGGTNRRAVQYTFQEFLCRPIQVWRYPGLPDDRVRRDVSRAPGGDAEAYQSECRTCHAGMDALGGAFARFDFTSSTLVYIQNNIARKMNQNGHFFPNGYFSTDDGWENRSTIGHNQSIGWRGTLKGMGVNAFGKMVANSKGFSECMAQHAFFQICRKDISATTKEALAKKFESEGYKLQSLFEDTAIHPDCI